MKVETYLTFEGRCEEAIEFYKRVLGAEVEMMMRMKDNPEPNPECAPAPGAEDKVLHASIRIGEARLMMSDGMQAGPAQFKGFALSLDPEDEATAQRVLAALTEGGQVQMPLQRTFWSPCFGMGTDRFGVAWMISVAPQ